MRTNDTRVLENLKNVPTPVEIKEYLDRYVIGQDEAKKTLAVAVYNHYKRLQLVLQGKVDKRDFGKSNCIILGPSGSGKTALVKAVARLLSVPYHIQDCTKITASGYVGSDVEDCIQGLLRNCNYSIPDAEMGIVMLDEIDKNRKESAGPSVTRDVSGECVQQSLLKIVEGDIVGVPPMGGRKHPEQSLMYVDTSNILFIASGAFVGLEDIVSKRIGRNEGRIGFREDLTGHDEKQQSSILREVIPEDLISYGMIPEFVGRFAVIANVEPLERKDLVRILTDTEDSLIRQYQQLLALDRIDLKFTPKAMDTIAEYADRMHTGARGLRGIIEKFMRDIMYEAPSMKRPIRGHATVTITDQTVRNAMQTSPSDPDRKVS